MREKEILHNSPACGQGLLSIFCDLEEKWHQEFCAWLSEDMFPARINVGFNACATYRSVSEVEFETQANIPGFLTLYECPSLANLYGEEYQSLRRNRDLRDTVMHEQMMGMERYTLSMTGPETLADKEGFSSFVFIDRFDLRPDDVQLFNAWYVTEYLSWCLKLPGLIRVRRYLAMEGAPRHFILHEFADMNFHEDAVWRALRKAKEWRLAGMTYGSPGLYECTIKVP
ncbi:MAG: hypothetical protein HOC91_16685 [Nitrospinaceae bacterium]|nr:hypothetical protein [Nitrospinaceae bacterium]MBT3432336.1 hypothetical protein [Nitrospinaceae bacterium]MBT3822247.1 hypothetical protein [Nitrospinaceae bacterium]MBT4092848.1 hypothetical protein [Nitrospinaceae bacterium]MBT4432148.1 hypothetical protein [Nitrospinaceae bacterium]